MVRSKTDRLMKLALGLSLCWLAGAVTMEAQAGYALTVTTGTNRSWQADAMGYNGKAQGYPWNTNPFNDTNIVNLLKRSMINNFRYPVRSSSPSS